MKELKAKLIAEHDKLNRIMDVLDGNKDNELTRWLYLNEYQKGIRFALDLIDEVKDEIS